MPKKEQEFVFHEPSAFLDHMNPKPITDPERLEENRKRREMLAKLAGMKPEEFEELLKG